MDAPPVSGTAISGEPTTPNATLVSQNFVTNLLKEIAANQARQPQRAFDLQFAFVRGNYYQVLHWLRAGRINAAVLSPFSYYVARDDEKDWPALATQPVLEFPTAGITPEEDGGAPYFRALENEAPIKDPYWAIDWCMHRNDDACTFDFVNHLSSTGFIYPLLRAYEQPHPASFRNILQRTQFVLWHTTSSSDTNELCTESLLHKCFSTTESKTGKPRRRVTLQFTYAGNLAMKA